MANYLPRKTSVDGTWSFGDTVNLQNYLKDVGYYSKSREADGVWGYWTTLALQGFLREKRKHFYPYDRYYEGLVDGQFGNMTKAAMGDAAYYLLGSGNYMIGYCAGGSCTIGWAHTAVVKTWQLYLNRNYGFAS
ncbi:peptidoglycan-binding domain-containing protein [Glutamicibacter sp. X7]